MPPAAPEARVSCPLCGGLVHPVAGRCKHCKGDLRGRRVMQPAHVMLPALGSTPSTPTNGSPTSLATTTPSLPSVPGETAPVRSMWRRWPTFVIALAVIVLALAAAALAWPVGEGRHEDAHAAAPPSAQAVPDPMPTHPAPAQPPQGVDPQSSATPSVPPTHLPDLQLPPPADDPGSNAHADPFGSLADPATSDFLTVVGRHLCDRLATCGSSNQTLQSYCTLWRAMPAPAPTTGCPAAQRCLDHVDHLGCSTPTNDPSALATLINQLPDCFDAITNC